MDTNTLLLIEALVVLVIIAVFFIMAERLKRIMVAIEGLAEIEFRKPENMKSVTCENCQKEFTITLAVRGSNTNCPHCKTITRLPEKQS